MLRPPSPVQNARELLLGRDVVRWALRSRSMRSLPRGDGAPAILVTGFGGGDLSLWPMRRLLVGLGHDARPVGLGRISDDVEGLHPMLAALAVEVADQTGRPVALVGWSIGGVLAREAARDRPDVVRRVITFGTPAVGGPSYTALAARYPEARLAEIRTAIVEREQQPIEVPITAIWSRNDGIVEPRACIDNVSPHVEHVEVTSTHIGMGVDPDVWATVADRLATAA